MQFIGDGCVFNQVSLNIKHIINDETFHIYFN